MGLSWLQPVVATSLCDTSQVNKWPNEGKQKPRQYPRAPIMQGASENYALDKLLMMSQ